MNYQHPDSTLPAVARERIRRDVVDVVTALRGDPDATVIQLARRIDRPREDVERALTEALAAKLVIKVGAKHWRAAPLPPTPAEKARDAERYLRRRAEWAMEAAAKARAALVARLSHADPVKASYEAVYALEWGTELAQEQHEAWLLALIVDDANEGVAESARGAANLHKRVRYWLDRLTRELLSSEYASRSTSMFANATNNAKGEAARHVREHLLGVVDSLEAVAVPAKEVL